MGKIESTVRIEFEVEMVVQALIVTGVEHSRNSLLDPKKSKNYILYTSFRRVAPVFLDYK